MLKGLIMVQDLPDELPRKRFWLKCVVVLALLAALGVGGSALYRRYEPVRLTRQARAYFQEGKTQPALLTVRRALQINPFSEPASRLMAEITEKVQAPEAVDWRQRVAELNKGTDDALAWAGAALRAGRIGAAEQALASVPDADRYSARYHAAAGATAMGGGHLKDAEEHFSEAVRLEPANELYQYNYATFQIQSADAAQRQQGAETLERLGKGGRVDVFAKRSRLAQLRHDKNDAEALRVSSELVQLPGATFNDKLEHLALLRRLDRPEWESFAKELRKSAASEKGENVAALANWIRENQGAAESEAWVDTLQGAAVAYPRVKEAKAENLVELKQWGPLQAFTSEGSWESLDYLRLAYLAKALREQGDNTGTRARWIAATAAARRREPLSQLAFLAARWGWNSELRDTLWAATNTPAPQWALQMLHRSYLSAGDSAGLLRVAQKAAELDPQNDAARNNVAALMLLTGRDRERARDMARQLYERSRSNAAFASTYALGLHLTGRSPEGLALLRQLPPDKLKEPSIAAYYGILLAANGAEAEAEEYLKLSDAAPLLPEEKTLIAAARKTALAQ